jgi:uncharacterized cupin superfamily protein
MEQIIFERGPSPEKLEMIGVYDWPIWEKEVSTFPWTYDEQETCYILSGHVVVTPENGESVELRAGDFVTFPRGMICTWDINEPIRKHYQFG